MAYDEDTYQVLHGLTKEGKVFYREFLEKKADEILFRHEHFFRWAFRKAVLFLKGLF